MKHETQVLLLEEVLGLKQGNQLFLDEQVTQNPVNEYLDAERFEREQQHLFRTLPSILAHASEIAEPNSFLRRTTQGLPLLILRGDDGEARVFLNVCRHRGTRLVDDHSGCKKRHSCPYHAWTWNSRGQFVAAPHFEAGFPGTDPTELGLKQLPSIERHGFIWLMPQDHEIDLSTFLGELDAELAWLDGANLSHHQTDEQHRQCNWKLLPEGGLEAYHFRIAHRNTIAKLFNDNLSSYQCLGPHIRSILPRASIVELAEQERSSWNIRDHSNVLYTVFPTSMFLVQSDHVIWIRVEPVGPEKTELRLMTLKPKETDKPSDYWDANHELTIKTLNEDFDLAESMQSGMRSGANESLRFGRFEGALSKFNETIRQHLV
ncbi:MAG: ring-hydroxylating oxygenase subunit alpha [Oceanococcus sp.]|nr:MAG: ring-hydroxylating oxygenase subunit alpha [Oceanococcus sp.]